MKGIFLAFILLGLLFSVNLASAQYDFYGYPNIKFIADILNIPENLLTFPNFIFNLLIPFIAIWAICLGFMRQIRIFSRSRGLETVIAFTMAFATLPTGALVAFVGWMLAMAGGYAVLFFFGLFILGVTVYSGIIAGGWWSAANLGSIERHLKNAQEEERKIREKAVKTQDPIILKDLERQLEAAIGETSYWEGQKARAVAERERMLNPHE